MKRNRWKILNAALWIEIVFSYFLPFQVTNHFQYQVGFPIPFLSIYNSKFGINPFMSMHLNPVRLLFDVFVIYLIISVCVKAYQKWRHNLIK